MLTLLKLIFFMGFATLQNDRVYEHELEARQMERELEMRQALEAAEAAEQAAEEKVLRARDK